MSFIPSPTTGIGVAAKVSNVPATITLSLGGTTTAELAPEAVDVAGNPVSATALVLSAVANASGTTSVYTGTITGGGSNAFAGKTFTVAGFTNIVNNGTFECSASSTTTLTLENPEGTAETHAGTATPDSTTAFKFISRSTPQATVSAAGVITAVAVGQAVVEASYPTFDNTLGTNPDGTYAEKVYAETTVQVTL